LVIRVVVVAVLALGLMLVIKDGRLTAKAKLVSRCQTVATPLGQTGQYRECTKGLIDGRRDLEGDGCAIVDSHGDVDVWRCAEGN
jgi:hypothetical protein